MVNKMFCNNTWVHCPLLFLFVFDFSGGILADWWICLFCRQWRPKRRPHRCHSDRLSGGSSARLLLGGVSHRVYSTHVQILVLLLSSLRRPIRHYLHHSHPQSRGRSKHLDDSNQSTPFVFIDILSGPWHPPWPWSSPWRHPPWSHHATGIICRLPTGYKLYCGASARVFPSRLRRYEIWRSVVLMSGLLTSCHFIYTYKKLSDIYHSARMSVRTVPYIFLSTTMKFMKLLSTGMKWLICLCSYNLKTFFIISCVALAAIEHASHHFPDLKLAYYLLFCWYYWHLFSIDSATQHLFRKHLFPSIHRLMFGFVNSFAKEWIKMDSDTMDIPPVATNCCYRHLAESHRWNHSADKTSLHDLDISLNQVTVMCFCCIVAMETNSCNIATRHKIFIENSQMYNLHSTNRCCTSTSKVSLYLKPVRIE